MGMGLCVAVLECAKLFLTIFHVFRVIRESLYGGLTTYTCRRWLPLTNMCSTRGIEVSQVRQSQMISLPSESCIDR